MTNRIFVRIIIVFLLLTGMSLGGYDLSGGTATKNISMAEFTTLGSESQTENAVLNAGAPQASATIAGTELAAYTNQAPPAADLGKLKSTDITATANQPMYIYYNGSYFGWNDFTAAFPSSRPSMWIERAAGWSWYATLPLGGWTRELLYVPTPSPITLYELYPEGYVIGYGLGFVQPGYYYIWYYADSPGRHRTVFATGSSYSNTVVIDIYSPLPPTPTPPSPQQQCESNPLCSWANGQCLCRGFNPTNPEQAKCEENPTCDWFNGNCYCRGYNPTNPEKEKCEQNPDCSWVNGQCLCTGFKPEPTPTPAPEPTPTPNPAQVNCEKNPTCQWTDGRCLCTGFGSASSGASSGSEESGSLLGSGTKNVG